MIDEKLKILMETMEQHQTFNILDELPIIIALHDKNNRIQWANKTYLNSIKVKLTKIQGQKCYDVWKLSKICEDCPVVKAFNDGKQHQFELSPENQKHWPKDQGYWLSIANPVKDEKGNTVAVFETSLDITQRADAENRLLKAAYSELNNKNRNLLAITQQLRASEQQLMASNQQLRANEQQIMAVNQQLSAVEQQSKAAELKFKSIFENVNDGILLADLKTKIFYTCNNKICQMLGYSLEEIANMGVSDIHPTEDLPYVLEQFEKQAKREIEIAKDLPVKRKDGSVFYADINASVITMYGINYLMGIFRDVTERRKAEEALRIKDKAMGSAISAIVISDMEGYLNYANPAFLKMWGYSSAEEVMGRLAIEFWQMAEKAKEVMGSIQARGEWVGELTGQRKDGTFFEVQVSCNIVKDITGSPLCMQAAFIDITKRKLLEEEKEKLQNQLHQSQKMDSIGTLTGGIAHDFNNLLGAIRGYAEISISNTAKDNPVYHDLNEITVIVDRAAELTKQLMLFGRKYPINAATLNINNIVLNIAKILKRLFSANIEVKIELQPDIWNINADESQIEQVIMNIAVNALDSMPSGGILTVKTENVKLDQEHLAGLSDEYPGIFVKLSMQDTGVGISNDVIKNIFDPFFTTKQKGKGTGLGLAVVYGIIKHHKGWIKVYSELGKGTLFSIFMPATLEKKQSITKEKVEYTDVAGHGERILLIEDEKELIECMNRALLMKGYVVFKASNAKEAFETYKKENGNFQMVISDTILPDISGPEVVSQLLLDNPELKVIFTSGYLDDKSQKEIIHAKVYKFLQKPYTLDALFCAIKEVLDNKG